MTQAIDPIAAPAGQQGHEQRQPQRHGLNFGAANSHREAVQAALRVDPAAVTERMRAPSPARGSNERNAMRDARHAEEDAARDRHDERGQHVDIEV